MLYSIDINDSHLKWCVDYACDLVSLKLDVNTIQGNSYVGVEVCLG